MQQKGTLLWHAHVSWLRATVYGAIIIYPKTGVPYPFPYPYEEHIIILGTRNELFIDVKMFIFIDLNVFGNIDFVS